MRWSALARATFLLCALTPVQSAAKLKCAEWCSRYTTSIDACVDCTGCGEKSCASFMESHATAKGAGAKCEVWCDAKTCGVEDCAGCDDDDSGWRKIQENGRRRAGRRLRTAQQDKV